MNASEFQGNLKFKGGMPYITIQDGLNGLNGRMFLHKGHLYLGAFLPEGRFFESDSNDVEFLSANCLTQERMTWAEAADFISVWQQTGDMEEALLNLEQCREAMEELDLEF